MVDPGRGRGGVWGVTASGMAVLVPGYPQWSWRQQGRGLVLFGSYATALGVGLFAWGTPTGLGALGFAYTTHVLSVLDLIRQRSFPGFGRWVPLLSTTGGLGLGIYFPALAVATLVAWPGMCDGPDREGYLVNCGAYRAALPEPGEWVWLRSSPWGNHQLGRVIAGPGQEVSWSGAQWRVDGRRVPQEHAGHRQRLPYDLRFTVPRDHVLIAPASPGPVPGDPLLVPRHELLGRAWAQLYPIRRRRLLP